MTSRPLAPSAQFQRFLSGQKLQARVFTNFVALFICLSLTTSVSFGSGHTPQSRPNEVSAPAQGDPPDQNSFKTHGFDNPIDHFESLIQTQNLTLIHDDPNQHVSSVLLFLADPQGYELQASLIEALGPNVEVWAVVPKGQSVSDFLNRLSPSRRNENLRIVEYPECFTPWAQDYFLRMTDGKKSLLIPTYSQNLQLNECKPFEIGIANLLESVAPQSFRRLGFHASLSSSRPNQTSVQSHDLLFDRHRVDRKNGEIYTESDAYARLYPVQTFKLFYGEGGMRIPSRHHLFIERTDWQKVIERFNYLSKQKNRSQEIIMKHSDEKATALDPKPDSARSYFERIFRKKLVPVGTTLSDGEYYSYHIDMFMTVVAARRDNSDQTQDTILLGHPKKTNELVSLDTLNRIPGFDSTLWQKKLEQANKIEQELLSQGFTVRRVPILFLNSPAGPQTITFNNVILSRGADHHPSVFIPNYQMPWDPIVMDTIRKDVEEEYRRLGLNVVWLSGGERLLGLNGQIRCATGVLRAEPHAKPSP